MTGIILFLGVEFCIAQKINHCTGFAVCCLEKKMVVEAATEQGGFWKQKKSEKISEHGANHSHRDSFTAWKETERSNTLGVSIDDCFEEETRDEKKRWK